MSAEEKRQQGLALLQKKMKKKTKDGTKDHSVELNAEQSPFDVF